MRYLMYLLYEFVHLYKIFKCDWPNCTNWVAWDDWLCREHSLKHRTTTPRKLEQYDFEGQHEAHTWLVEADLAGHGLAKELVKAQIGWMDDDRWWDRIDRERAESFVKRYRLDGSVAIQKVDYREIHIWK